MSEWRVPLRRRLYALSSRPHARRRGLVVDSDDEARDLRIAWLEALGTEQVNPNAQHYYLTRAVELRDDFVAGFDKKPTASTVGQLPVEDFVRAMPVFLKVRALANPRSTAASRPPVGGNRVSAAEHRVSVAARHHTRPSCRVIGS